MDKDNLENLTVGGYIFATNDDAEFARNEIKKIAYIETKMDMSNMNIVLGIYNKALENRTFQTPIGLEFMHGLYNMLIASGMEPSEIQPMPLYTTFKRLDISEKNKRKLTKRETNELSLKIKLRNSVLINLILALLVLVLIIITFNGSTMTAINYKAAVTNQYSAWEQELTEREAAVREKERELNIQNND